MKVLNRYYWKLKYFYKYYMLQPLPVIRVVWRRIKFKSAGVRWLRVGDIRFTHDVGRDTYDTRLAARIKAAATLPERGATLQEIQEAMYSGGTIKTKGYHLIDGHGRCYAITQAKGPDYLIEVEYER